MLLGEEVIFTEKLLHLRPFLSVFSREKEKGGFAGWKEAPEVFATGATNLGEITGSREGTLDSAVVKVGLEVRGEGEKDHNLGFNRQVSLSKEGSQRRCRDVPPEVGWYSVYGVDVLLGKMRRNPIGDKRRKLG
ncbi:MAG TPA: hypothetical protein PKN47_20680 [Nitrospira sp.]|nr:hypothetical protein [Nitrospira sp.]